MVKVVSGSDEKTAKIIADVYSSIITAGIHIAPSIKTAEAAKVIENTQRDLNIALMNELSIIFEKLGIRTKDVIEAASTKWNFHRYMPGLVGGHCIGVDPYYLTYKAQELGYHPQVILAGRAINDYMATHVGERIIKGLNRLGKIPKKSSALILGLTFKENINDTRNSKVRDLIKYLKEYDVDVFAYDPMLEDEQIASFGVKKFSPGDKAGFDVIVLATAHSKFRDLHLEDLKEWSSDSPYLFDVRNFFNPEDAEASGFRYESL
ncbi:nucleotide sugar dehydrogenase [Candidatus Woesearchaeota archaeon]|nr:MAG: nucleotide sugar dehydrogenase [Candidatus Woesearchaeota archaeon]